MNKHWKYFKYVTKHRWYVFLECCKLGIPWRGLIHDLSKYRWDEWFPYVEQFNGEFGYNFKESDYPKEIAPGIYETGIEKIEKHKQTKDNFNKAWLLHQHRNFHHWQSWMLTMDNDPDVILEMPDCYMKEMLADWVGAGLAITGKRETLQWYEKNKDKIKLAPGTRFYIENMLTSL